MNSHETTRELEAARAKYRGKIIPKPALAVMDAETARLAASNLAGRALKMGESAPDFILPDAHGEPVRLYSLLREGPVGLFSIAAAGVRIATSASGAFSAVSPNSVNLARRSSPSLHNCQIIRFLRSKRTSLRSRC